MRTFLSIMLLLTATRALATPADLPSVKEVQLWGKKAPALTSVLIKNGWLKKQSYHHLVGSSVFQNRDQSTPLVFVMKKSAMLPAKESLEAFGKRECAAALSQRPSAESKIAFDAATETFTCWIREPGRMTKQKEQNFFFRARTLAQGSRHINIEAAEVPVDEKSPKPSPVGRKIASELAVP